MTTTAVPSWKHVASIWATVQDVDVGAIRAEGERPVAIACIGHETALAEVAHLLYAGGTPCALAGRILTLLPLLGASRWVEQLRSADMLIIALSARRALSLAEARALMRVEELRIPYAVVLTHGTELPPGPLLPPAVAARVIAIADPEASDASEVLAAEVLLRLPAALHLAAARKLPSLRPGYARTLIAQVSLSNAAYSFATGLPAQMSLLALPFAVADIFILTKNEALMVYRLGLAHGAAADINAYRQELANVLGGAFVWREVARTLAGLCPVLGLAPKIAVAYSGTYTTGRVAQYWFERRERVSPEQLRRISEEALALGRERAAELIGQARTGGEGALGRVRGMGARILRRAKRVEMAVGG